MRKLRDSLISILKYAELHLATMPDDVKQADRHISQWIEHGWFPDESKDGSEPVTEEWLKQIGFNAELQLPLGPMHIQAYAGSDWDIVSENKAEYYGHREEAGIGRPKTRGEVRQLCRALGIDLGDTTIP